MAFKRSGVRFPLPPPIKEGFDDFQTLSCIQKRTLEKVRFDKDLTAAKASRFMRFDVGH